MGHHFMILRSTSEQHTPKALRRTSEDTTSRVGVISANYDSSTMSSNYDGCTIASYDRCDMDIVLIALAAFKYKQHHSLRILVQWALVVAMVDDVGADGDAPRVKRYRDVNPRPV